MSNTDGEDTITKIIDKFYENRPESRRVYSSVLISEIAKSFASKELASLREQLKQQEEVIRELIPLAYRAKSGLWANDPYAVHVDEIIEKAKSLTTKDK